jgi:amidohydrolase
VSDHDTCGRLKQRVLDEVESLKKTLIGISHDIHSSPELSWKEYQASDLLARKLEDRRAKVTRGVAGLETAFMATFAGQSEHPTIAFLAEYDALPGIGHGCGHNIIASAALGAGLALQVVLPELGGRVEVIGTPAKESPGGKVVMVDRGVFDGVDVAMMIHPWTDDSFLGSLAFHDLTMEFHGVPAHAAAHPDKGVNALDAMVLTYTSIGALRQQLRSDARIHGIITNGGAAPNIIPEYSAGRFFVRAAELGRFWRPEGARC